MRRWRDRQVSMEKFGNSWSAFIVPVQVVDFLNPLVELVDSHSWLVVSLSSLILILTSLLISKSLRSKVVLLVKLVDSGETTHDLRDEVTLIGSVLHELLQERRKASETTKTTTVELVSPPVKPPTSNGSIAGTQPEIEEVNRFFDACTVATPDGQLRARETFRLYCERCQGKRVTAREFYKIAESRFGKEADKKGVYYPGVSLKKPNLKVVSE
jgi:hypothetical protein